MPSKKIEVMCPISKKEFIRYRHSVDKAHLKTGFWACKQCTLKDRNIKNSSAIGSLRVHKTRQRPQVKTKFGWQDTHRAIVEFYLGRRLDSCEVVHHIDTDKFNNKIWNLDIMLNCEHTRYHNLTRKRM